MSDKWIVVIAELIKGFGVWDFSSLFVLLILVPWFCMIGIFWLGLRGYRETQKAALDAQTATAAGIATLSAQLVDIAAKYDNNIQFVRNYETLTRDHKASLDTLLQYVRENTQVMSNMTAHLQWMQK